MRYLLALIFAVLPMACTHQSTAPNSSAATSELSPAVLIAAPASRPATQDWPGVYASPSEIGGLAGTVVSLCGWRGSSTLYRMRRYSDAHSANEIKQDEEYGSYLAHGDVLYLPEASGQIRDGKPDLMASIERYTRVQINGQFVLMRDDALEAFKRDDKLYDYGILIKVSDQSDGLVDLAQVNHPSIKTLYSHSGRPWSDPFVHGPNGR